MQVLDVLKQALIGCYFTLGTIFVVVCVGKVLYDFLNDKKKTPGYVLLFCFGFFMFALFMFTAWVVFLSHFRVL